jgi:hypothetical protein
MSLVYFLGQVGDHTHSIYGERNGRVDAEVEQYQIEPYRKEKTEGVDRTDHFL